MGKRFIDSRRCFTPLYGKCCWNTGYKLYANLYMDFGKPLLSILEYRKGKKITRSNFLRNECRRISVRGEWTFFLNMAYFRILRKGDLLASVSSSNRQIRKVVDWLEGQKLVHAQICDRTGKTRLDFDLGAQVEIRRCDANSKEILWYLYGPNTVCWVKGDGSFEWKAQKAD
jgi:hypothetical protein